MAKIRYQCRNPDCREMGNTVMLSEVVDTRCVKCHEHMRQLGPLGPPVDYSNPFKGNHPAEPEKNEMEIFEVFWFVWNPTYGAPSKQHSDSEDAMKEAKRLSEKHPGCRYYVLKATSAWICDISEPRFLGAT